MRSLQASFGEGGLFPGVDDNFRSDAIGSSNTTSSEQQLSSASEISFSLGVYFVWAGLLVCICLLCVCSYRSYYSERRIVSKKEIKDLPENERRIRLEQILEKSGNQMVITEESIKAKLEAPKSTNINKDQSNETTTTDDKDDDDNDTIPSEVDEEMGDGSQILILPLRTSSVADIENNTKKTTMTGDATEHEGEKKYYVSNCCAICLEKYKAGEHIVWSSSLKDGCSHVYHRTCMIDYLLSYRGEDGSPCPTCRRDFIECSDF